MLQGIYPILFTPFDADGDIDAESLRRVARFELEGGAHGIGIGGFASEAYKLTDAERLRCAEIVAAEVGDHVPLIIGMAAGSAEAAVHYAHAYAQFRPAALMVLPPNTMKLDESALIAHYIRFADSVEIPIMVQQSPHIMAYAGCELSVEGMAEIARHAPNVIYFKIEGSGSAAKIRALYERVGDRARLFGGIGGLGMREEFEAGASGLLPGVGFNEIFMRVWAAWAAGDKAEVDRILSEAQPLVQAVSGRGHEFSLHARKYLMQRAGIIRERTVRFPTVEVAEADLQAIAALVDSLNLRISAKVADVSGASSDSRVN